ncbi:hypothetical protein CAPTEDRAFT_206056 [Capitella teleta]|uniref:Uncharacterized protein n=1 Tax=Capitella teleta TaxID=283909 RepID=R7UQR3_CAPTE|nr:hypothetical protein CAPTEDRAFT_206056 [Capitella teleta]|eukprot:ELU08869.1 hypothetical protein CAPTEDRAFT_206056 [Capitella teleta]
MGGIGCVTPDSGRSRHTIKRSTKLVKADVTGEFGKVAIKAYKKPFVSALSCIKVSSLFPDELNPRSQKLSFALDQLWMASMTLPDANLGAPSPSWGGFMQLASKGEIYEKTRIEILPFINLQPTNRSSIYTALNFAREQSSLHDMETCFVTFDQSLYAKAIEIVASDDQEVEVRLGGFHLLMGSVGYIMGGSGLEVLWESAYAPSISEMEDKTKESLSALHKAIIGQKRVDLKDEKVMQTLIKKNQQWIKTEKERSRTGRLWLNYMEQVSLIKQFIYAERTGDWALHLNSIRQMIPYFYAARHIAYANISADHQDFIIFLEWLKSHSPFIEHQNQDSLTAISTGPLLRIHPSTVIAHWRLEWLQLSALDNQLYSEIKLRRTHRVKSIGSSTNTVKIRGQPTVVNLMLLFNRITCVMQSSSDMEAYLACELAPQPTALFTDGVMRKTNKNIFGQLLKSQTEAIDHYPVNSTFIVDGG